MHQLLFSTGKDSIVSGELLFKGGIPFTCYFFYFVPDWPCKVGIINYYAKRWKCEVKQFPDYTCLNLQIGNSRYKFSDNIARVRADGDCGFVVSGKRMNDSMVRRAQLKKLPVNEKGWKFDEKNRNLFPIWDWTDGKVMSFLKYNKLPLPRDYNVLEFGKTKCSDFSVPYLSSLAEMKSLLPKDYEAMIRFHPQLKTMYEDRFGKL